MLDPVTIATMIRREQELRYAEAERRFAQRAALAVRRTAPKTVAKRDRRRTAPPVACDAPC